MNGKRIVDFWAKVGAALAVIFFLYQFGDAFAESDPTGTLKYMNTAILFAPVLFGVVLAFALTPAVLLAAAVALFGSDPLKENLKRWFRSVSVPLTTLVIYTAGGMFFLTLILG